MKSNEMQLGMKVRNTFSGLVGRIVVLGDERFASVYARVFEVTFDDNLRGTRHYAANGSAPGQFVFTRTDCWEQLEDEVCMPDTRDYLDSLNGLESIRA